MTLADKLRALCRRMYADQFTGKAPELLALADEAEALEMERDKANMENASLRSLLGLDDTALKNGKP